MKKICILLFSAIMSGSAMAGYNALTHHSRANCVNNETISWHKGHQYWFWINSRHRHEFLRQDHQVIHDWNLTWRAAAVHWGEPGGGAGQWSVQGYHWMRAQNNAPVQVKSEYVTDCSIYDGWWD